MAYQRQVVSLNDAVPTKVISVALHQYPGLGLALSESGSYRIWIIDADEKGGGVNVNESKFI